MITYQIEQLPDIIEDIKRLGPIHWAEVSPFRDVRPFNPNWELYLDQYRKGGVFSFTARDGNELVGYCFFTFITMSHYKHITLAINDTLYLKPEYRKGMTGYKLITKAEEEVKKLNVQEIMWRTKLGDSNFGKLLERLGYFPEEVSYTKMVNI